MAYIYAHARATGPRAGSIFFIGKGKRANVRQIGGRAYCYKDRSTEWQSIVKQSGLSVMILVDGLEEHEAQAMLPGLITQLKPYLCNKLVNINSPMKGFKHTPETKAKISAARQAYNKRIAK